MSAFYLGKVEATTVHLPWQLKVAVRKAAQAQGVSVSAYVAGLLGAELERQGCEVEPATFAERIESLPPRTRMVVQGVIDGKTNKELAREMNIAPETVRTMGRAGLARLGVPNRRALLAGALKLPDDLRVPGDPVDHAIVRRVAAGMTDEEIGAELGLSRTTIENRSKKLRHRLGARNRLHLIILLTTGAQDADRID